MSLAQRITSHCGGTWCGHYGLIPTPGHDKRDRGTLVRDIDDGDDDVIVHSFNGGDWREIKDEFRRRGLLPDRCTRRLSAAEQAALKRERREAAAQRQREAVQKHKAAAVRAWNKWTAARPADPRHGYLVKKNLDGEGLRQIGRELLVPLCDITGRLWNLQRIWPGGFRLYLEDARTKGLMFLVGEVEGRLCVAEGVATAKAIRAATGYPVAAAMTWSNMEAVARLLRQRWPAAEITVCADDDQHLLANPHIRRNLGLEAATAAAAAIGARLAVPLGRAV